MEQNQNQSLATQNDVKVGLGGVNVPDEFNRQLNFIRYKLDINDGTFVNDATGEKSTSLLVRIDEVRLERVRISKNGEFLCGSNDTIASREGVVCKHCPYCNNSPYISSDDMAQSFAKETGKPSSDWIGDCQLRLIVQWNEQFVPSPDNQGLMYIKQPGLCVLSCGRSSIANMLFAKVGYGPKLKSLGFKELKEVVTKIIVSERERGTTKIMYSYETFDFYGKFEDTFKNCINFNNFANNQIATAEQQQLPEQTPTPPCASVPQATTNKQTPPPANLPKTDLSEEPLLVTINKIYNSLPVSFQMSVMKIINENGFKTIAEVPTTKLNKVLDLVNVANAEYIKTQTKDTGSKKPW